MTKRVNKIEAAMPQLKPKKRVAAYARVSSGKDAMLMSLSAQVSYYSELIQKNPDWEYTGVYSDEALTGTKDTRENFQKLLTACRNGEVDLVITKSISRFARNTVTLLETVREMKMHGVDVYFERENIHSMSGDGELMLTILASFAQEESLSASENQKWRIKKNFSEGKPWNGVMLGYRLENGKYIVILEEAAVVRKIFRYYLDGYGYIAIAKKLNEEGVQTRLGNEWTQTSLSKILKNYAYTGNLLLQKTYRENHITKKTLINHGELPMYHATDAHEAIIDTATFQAVQEEMKRRADKFKKNKSPAKNYAFTGKLICEKCGKNYRRKTTHTGIVWICPTYNTLGKSACSSKAVPENTLEKICVGLDFENITVCDNNILIVHLSDGTDKTIHWKDRSRSESWTEEMRNAARQKTLQRRNAKWQKQ